MACSPVVSAIKEVVKGIGFALGMAVTVLPALLCWVEGRLSRRDVCFLFWAEVFALCPGLPGKYLRKCFYRLTLKACSLDCDIGFLSVFNHRQTEIGERVYVGSGAVVGLVTIGAGTLIGNRVSIMNGGWQHHLGPDRRLTPCDSQALARVRIGEET